jgi:succinyl-CoA synthetase beta subunit
VLKIASPAIQHKSDVGGVRLDLDDEHSIATAFDEIVAAARQAHPDAPIEGCLAVAMRPRGIELFVGTARSAWGPVIAAGLGGIWIEALADTSLRLLPITDDDAEAMLGELRGSRLLDGYRGQPGADRRAIARAIRAIGDAALALGPDLVSLEVNPLLARAAQVEALDALAVWDDGTSAQPPSRARPEPVSDAAA